MDQIFGRSLVCCLALALAFTAPCRAESTVAQGTGPLTASARLSFGIVIPATLRLAVATDAGGGVSLDTRLVSRHGPLTVTSHEGGTATPLPVAQSERRRAEALYSGRLDAGVYTVASP